MRLARRRYLSAFSLTVCFLLVASQLVGLAQKTTDRGRVVLPGPVSEKYSTANASGQDKVQAEEERSSEISQIPITKFKQVSPTLAATPHPTGLNATDAGFETEPNGTAATATPLGGTNVRIKGDIFPNADIDFFSFSATAGDRVYAAVMTSDSSNASVDSVLDVIAPDGTTVLETDLDDGSFGTTSSGIAGVTLAASGTHYLRVRHQSATTQLRPYELYLNVQSGAPTPEVEANDTFPGLPLPASGWVSGSTSATTDLDFYSINLNAGDTVFASLDLDPERDTTEWNAQLGLGAFGTPPLILVVNDGGTGTPDSESFFMTVKSAGTYGVFSTLR